MEEDRKYVKFTIQHNFPIFATSSKEDLDFADNQQVSELLQGTDYWLIYGTLFLINWWTFWWVTLLIFKKVMIKTQNCIPFYNIIYLTWTMGTHLTFLFPDLKPSKDLIPKLKVLLKVDWLAFGGVLLGEFYLEMFSYYIIVCLLIELSISFYIDTWLVLCKFDLEFF